jgi:hypothetical protein
MSKKDYIKFARFIAEEVKPRLARDEAVEVASKLAAIFIDDNSRFDYQRFMAACGLA